MQRVGIFLCNYILIFKSVDSEAKFCSNPIIFSVDQFLEFKMSKTTVITQCHYFRYQMS